MARKPKLSPKEKDQIKCLVQKRQKLKAEITKLEVIKGYHSPLHTKLTAAQDLALNARRIGMRVPTEAMNKLRKFTKEMGHVNTNLKAFRAQLDTIKREEDVLYATQGGKCPLCGKSAPCPVTY